MLSNKFKIYHVSGFYQLNAKKYYRSFDVLCGKNVKYHTISPFLLMYHSLSNFQQNCTFHIYNKQDKSVNLYKHYSQTTYPINSPLLPRSPRKSSKKHHNSFTSYLRNLSVSSVFWFCFMFLDEMCGYCCWKNARTAEKKKHICRYNILPVRSIEDGADVVSQPCPFDKQ